MLRLQTKCGTEWISLSSFAFGIAIRHKVTAVKLQSRLGCQDLHFYTGFGCVHRSDLTKTVTFDQFKVMVVTFSYRSLRVFCVDTGSDRLCFAKIKCCPGYWQAFTGRD